MPLELGRRLIAAGLVIPEEVEAALFLSVLRGIPFTRALLDRGAITERALEEELDRLGDLPLRQVVASSRLMGQLPRAICRRLGAVPVRIDAATGTVEVAAADPFDPHVAAEMAFHLGAPIRILRASIGSIEEAIRRMELMDAEGQPPSLSRLRRATPPFPHGAPESAGPRPPELPIPLTRYADSEALLSPDVDDDDDLTLTLPELPGPESDAAQTEPEPVLELVRAKIISMPAPPPSLSPPSLSPSSQPPPPSSEPLSVEPLSATPLSAEILAEEELPPPPSPYARRGANIAPNARFLATFASGGELNTADHRPFFVEPGADDDPPTPLRSAPPPPLDGEPPSVSFPSLPPGPEDEEDVLSVKDDEILSMIDDTIENAPDTSPGVESSTLVMESSDPRPSAWREPGAKHEPTAWREPGVWREPAARREPISKREPTSKQEPVSKREPTSKQEPFSKREPTSKQEPVSKQELAPMSAALLRPPNLGPVLSELREATTRDAVIALALRGLELVARRAAVFAVRKDSFKGWACNAALGDEKALRDVSIPQDEPSIFSAATANGMFLGPIPATLTHASLLHVMGLASPDVAAVPARVAGRPALILLADELRDTMLGTRQMEEIARAVGEALTRAVAQR